MNVEKILVTGDRFMINRHQLLFKELSSHTKDIQYLDIDKFSDAKLLKNFAKLIKKRLPFLPIKPVSNIRKSANSFINTSRHLEKKIRNLKSKPDLIFHLYGLYSPLWDEFDIPYVTYLDYTMALARRNWSSWAPFSTEQEFASWIECERRGYQNTQHLFTMSSLAKRSLIEDYGINPEQITVVGTSGKFLEPYQGEKKFGSKQILFNGYDFTRKGGELVVAAFEKVKQQIPEAKLIIVGDNLSIKQDGVYNPGYISSSSEMKNIFIETDLVVAPALCEPLGIFLIEAMNYGVPCIVSENGGISEIIDREVSGIVISQSTPELLASQIVNLLSDSNLLKEMSEDARHKVKNQFNWNHIAQKMSNAISKI
ncbi:MAG: glycosyltransferase family 4 protein [Cyanobacteriota bacterium]|nr:glycosyltransferase family 4 protein [Cyanobacteriota bacterium]